jgi:hypothetical protein
MKIAASESLRKYANKRASYAVNAGARNIIGKVIRNALNVKNAGHVLHLKVAR